MVTKGLTPLSHAHTQAEQHIGRKSYFSGFVYTLKRNYSFGTPWKYSLCNIELLALLM